MTSQFVEFHKLSKNIWQAQFGYSSRKLEADENHSTLDEIVDVCWVT
jgi:hypothetical protein